MGRRAAAELRGLRISEQPRQLQALHRPFHPDRGGGMIGSCDS